MVQPQHGWNILYKTIFVKGLYANQIMLLLKLCARQGQI